MADYIENTDEIIRIAFTLNGGLGTVLVRANFIKCFRELFPNKNINIKIFGHPHQSVNDALFKGQNFIDEYYNHDELHPDDYCFYDAVILVDAYPNIVWENEQKIRKLNPKLHKIFLAWNSFKKDDNNAVFFSKIREAKQNLYHSAIINGKTCLDSVDIGNDFSIGHEYSMDIMIHKDECTVLEYFGLEKNKFITLQRGINPKIKDIEPPKLWPLHYYTDLVYQIKEQYPDLKIVQLGESFDRCKIIEGVDLNLVGKTDWDDVKILLKHALLHIDGECGMVHLRKALKTGPSVVLFGQTPVEYFGYQGNINIKTDACPHWCAELHAKWETSCLLGENAPCMHSLVPSIVMKHITAFIDHDSIINTYQHEKIDIHQILIDENIQLDEKWFNVEIANKPLYYCKVDHVQIDKLLFQLFSPQCISKYTLLPIAESPVLQYIKGNKERLISYYKMQKQYDPVFNHSTKRLDELLINLTQYGYDEKKIIVVDGKNRILDGHHRACWLYSTIKNTKKIKIRVLKLYRDFFEE